VGLFYTAPEPTRGAAVMLAVATITVASFSCRLKVLVSVSSCSDDACYMFLLLGAHPLGRRRHYVFDLSVRLCVSAYVLAGADAFSDLRPACRRRLD